MTLLLGIDLGTSSVKAVVYETDTSRLIAAAGEEYPIHRPTPERAEQDPHEWWHASVIAVRRALALSGHAGTDISAIGLSGQMHSTVLLDEQGVPVHPAIIWADQRASLDEAAAIVESTLGDGEYHKVTGTMPALGFMGVTLNWLIQHDSQTLAKTRHVIFPKDFLRFKLTGETATEITDAAGSGIFDIQRKDWAREIILQIGLPEEIFPPVYASSAVAAFLTRSAAEEMGLRSGIPVVYGCADQPAQAIGNGLIAPGHASLTIGSGGQVFMPMQADLGEKVSVHHALHVFNHAAPDTYYALGAILTAGLSLRWLRGIVGLEGQTNAYEILSAEAAQVPVGADELTFLPFLLSDRSPWENADYHYAVPQGGFVGLRLAHERGHLVRAAMEGVAFALKKKFDLCEMLAGKADTVIASGGGMESPVWRGIMTDVLGIPLHKSAMPEAAGVGAALLAGVGTNIYKSFDKACAGIKHGDITEPNPANVALYAEKYERYLELVRQLATPHVPLGYQGL